MSDNRAQGFLQDILAHPDDDTPRLVFADWLEDQGDAARAEFIRVQIERARLPQWDARQVSLRLRERAVLEQHGEATAALSSFAVFRQKRRTCWAAAPIEAVSVRSPRRDEAVEAIAPIAGLRELSINGWLQDREAGRLANAPLLSTVRQLNIIDGSLEAEGFRRLVASPHLGQLTALRVPYSLLDNEAVDALSSATSLTSLAELDLSGLGDYGSGEPLMIDASGLQALVAWPGMSRLRSLTLSANDVRRRGLRVLLRSPAVSGLKELVLCNSGLGGQAMQEFASATPQLQLDVLDLGQNLLRDLGAEHLARAPCLGELKVLQLDRCEIGSAGARALAGAPFLGGLRQLHVNSNRFGPEGLRALLEAEPQELHTLQMIDNDLGDEGVSSLAESAASDVLLDVNLAQNGLTDQAAQALARSQHLQNLLVLGLTGNRIGKPAEAALASSPLGKRLAVLQVVPEDPAAGEADIPDRHGLWGEGEV